MKENLFFTYEGKNDMTDSPEYREKTKRRLERKTETSDQGACRRWVGSTAGDGYGRTSYAGKPEYVHRVVAMLHLDYDPSSGKVVMHLCDNPPCCNPTHLTIGTQAENVADSIAKGRRTPGKKLNSNTVSQIKYRLGLGESQLALARSFGVSTTTIGQIARGQTWKKVRAAEQTDVSNPAGAEGNDNGRPEVE